MNSKLKKIINEEINRSIEEKNKYEKTRALVEGLVRESLIGKLLEAKKKKKRKKKNTGKTTKLSQVQQALSDPSINKSGLARKISGLSSDDDARRSEISKIARGVWTPPTDIQNDILHKIANDS